VRSWSFLNVDAARAWNAEWERVLADPSRIHSALLVVESTPIPDATLDLAARIAAGVMQQEIAGGAPLPEVASGWGFSLTVSHAYTIPSFSWQREELVLSVSWSVLDAEAQPLWTVDAVREYDLRRLPQMAPRILTAVPRRDTTEIYAPAGIASDSTH
jgi:hypothetical protein